ncbi:hypothetical protein [Streptomyces sp. NPDC059122]|uniref:hypothetical protein n=1 Tax=Streptomyces sp. NPDC059122 TaxID=3346732 RepID=UPI0036AF24CC
MTRQTEKVITCKEGPLNDLRELARPTASDTVRRPTGLTTAPKPVPVVDQQCCRIGLFDANLIHVTHFGLPVRSKTRSSSPTCCSATCKGASHTSSL